MSTTDILLTIKDELQSTNSMFGWNNGIRKIDAVINVFNSASEKNLSYFVGWVKK